MINDMIRFCYEQGWSGIIYDSNVILTFIAEILFLLFYRKKYGITLTQTLATSVIVYPLIIVLIIVLGWIESGFQSWNNKNFERVCVYIPLFALLASKVLKVPFGKMVDFLAPSIALQKVLGPLACAFFGCCYGCECSWGIWNPIIGTKVFPVQWLECLVVLLIVYYLLYLAKKEEYAGTGKIYAYFLLLYGGARFLLGILKGGEKLFLWISNLEVHAFLMVLVGTAWLMTLYEKEQLRKSKQNSIH